MRECGRERRRKRERFAPPRHNESCALVVCAITAHSLSLCLRRLTLRHRGAIIFVCRRLRHHGTLLNSPLVCAITAHPLPSSSAPSRHSVWRALTFMLLLKLLPIVLPAPSRHTCLLCALTAHLRLLLKLLPIVCSAPSRHILSFSSRRLRPSAHASSSAPSRRDLAS